MFIVVNVGKYTSPIKIIKHLGKEMWKNTPSLAHFAGDCGRPSTVPLTVRTKHLPCPVSPWRENAKAQRGERSFLSWELKELKD